ncbi:protein of unknown function [Pseudomonas mediterranea]
MSRIILSHPSPPDSLAIPGVSGIPLSDGVQRYLNSSDDEHLDNLLSRAEKKGSEREHLPHRRSWLLNS